MNFFRNLFGKTTNTKRVEGKFAVETRAGADSDRETERIRAVIQALLNSFPDAKLTEEPKLVATQDGIMVMLTIDCEATVAPNIQKRLSALLHASEQQISTKPSLKETGVDEVSALAAILRESLDGGNLLNRAMELGFQIVDEHSIAGILVESHRGIFMVFCSRAFHPRNIHTMTYRDKVTNKETCLVNEGALQNIATQ